MCTRSVEMSIRKLDFVDSVSMDLAQTEGVIFLKPGSTPDLRKVAKAVTQAGFSVRFLHIAIEFDHAVSKPCFSVGADSFQFVDEHKGQAKPAMNLMLIGDEFMPRKQFEKFRKRLVERCDVKNVYHVAAV
jgi:hypothetical protein